MSTALHATDRAVRALAGARPPLVDVVPAADLVAHLAAVAALDG